MDIRGQIKRLFSFSVPSTTILTLLVYIAIFTSSIVLYELPPRAPAPPEQRGLDLGRAFRDLQTIARRPHPYNSHANGVVRAHVLERVREVARLYNNVHVADDVVSNATWCAAAAAPACVYFEGDNVLVRVDGREPRLPGAAPAVLLSAHFDSVATAPGATDDGMGVATLLQLVDYFAAHTPERTVVFNINNGEEDGLHGARAFLEHPWSSLPDSFLNLEGAGSGGRPLLFRTSSASVTRAFMNVPHPHGSVLTSDAFSMGLIRSGTDFSIYAARGMKGLDLAFYRQRSLYHTKDDSVPSLGGADALWNMMEAALTSAIALTERSTSESGADEPAVYFDVYGETLLVYTLRTAFIINLVFLVVGPLLVAAAVALLHTKGKLRWPSRGWSRLPLAFVLSLGLTVALSLLLVYVNPYIVYSSGYTVVVSLISLALIGMYAPLGFLSRWRPVPQQKSIVLLETYVLGWILLVFDTVMVNVKKIGGFYFITFFHAAVFLALMITFVEHFWLPPSPLHDADVDTGDAGAEAEADTHEDREEAHTETTPLLQQRRPRGRSIQKEASHYGFWIVEYLVLVPFPVMLVSQICVMLLGGLPQTLADGSSPLVVYLGLAALSVLLTLPLAPFAHTLHPSLPGALLAVLLATSLYNVTAFPFSRAAPMKVFFAQTLDLDTGVNAVQLTGVRGFVDARVVPALPSAGAARPVTCGDSGQRRGLRTCTWEGLGPAPPAVVPTQGEEWLTYNASRVARGKAVLSVRGVDTRACRVYFDRRVVTAAVVRRVDGDGGGGTVESGDPVPVPVSAEEGVAEVRLWSRVWGRTFVVDVAWEEGGAGEGEGDGDGERLTGRVACGWAERVGEEGGGGGGGGSGVRIPALAEVEAFVPAWVEVTKADDALVEVSRRFEV